MINLSEINNEFNEQAFNELSEISKQKVEIIYHIALVIKEGREVDFRTISVNDFDKLYECHPRELLRMLSSAAFKIRLEKEGVI